MNALQARMEKLSATRAAIKLPKVRKPHWLKPELRVRVCHLAGGDTLRHASVHGLATDFPLTPTWSWSLPPEAMS
jgi:hypothetical protein